MKTAMQEHIEWLQNEFKKLVDLGFVGEALNVGDCIQHAESMLEKEKESLKEAINKNIEEIDSWYECDSSGVGFE